MTAVIQARINTTTSIVALACVASLAGCASIGTEAGLDEVASSVKQRIDKDVAWSRGTTLDRQVVKEVRELLTGELTAEEAVQVALLNNRDLQSTYSDLGVAQADLVEAGLLKNPVFEAVATVPESGGQADLELGVEIDFLRVFYRPLRKRVARSRLETARLHVTRAVLDLAGRTRTSFYRHQTDLQMLELRRQVVQSTEASLAAARKLRAAGNIPVLDLARERARAQEAKLELRSAELAVRASRERLNTLMGLWGVDTQWQAVNRLPEVPEEPMPLEDVERRAIEQSIELAAARQRIVTAGEALGLQEESALIPEAEVGAVAEREEGEWEAGPAFAVPLPIFDRGQDRIGRARAELRRVRQAHYATTVRIRSAARIGRDRVTAARDRVLYYRDVQLPIRERVVREAQLQYNAMQLGIFGLLRAREQQIATGERYIRALERYWLARANLEMLLSGHLTDPGANATEPTPITGGEAGMGANERGH